MRTLNVTDNLMLEVWYGSDGDRPQVKLRNLGRERTGRATTGTTVIWPEEISSLVAALVDATRMLTAGTASGSSGRRTAETQSRESDIGKPAYHTDDVDKTQRHADAVPQSEETWTVDQESREEGPRHGAPRSGTAMLTLDTPEARAALGRACALLLKWADEAEAEEATIDEQS